MKYQIIETPKSKHVRSDNYNFDFDKKSGFFARWGKTMDDDPQVGLPEIADIEITTKCSGPAGKLCKFCSPKGTNVQTPAGDKNIEELNIGDIVYSYNGKEKVENTIVETYKHNTAKELVKITLEDGSSIELTPDHEIFMMDGTLKNAGDIGLNDEIKTINEV